MFKTQTNVVTNGEGETIRNFTIFTHRITDAYRQDIVLKDFKKETCELIDMTCPHDSNVSKRINPKCQIIIETQ